MNSTPSTFSWLVAMKFRTRSTQCCCITGRAFSKYRFLNWMAGPSVQILISYSFLFVLNGKERSSFSITATGLVVRHACSRPIIMAYVVILSWNHITHSTNTPVGVTRRKRVHWGQTPFRVNDDQQISQLEYDGDPELGQPDPIICQVCRKLTKFRVTFDRNGVWLQWTLFGWRWPMQVFLECRSRLYNVTWACMIPMGSL